MKKLISSLFVAFIFLVNVPAARAISFQSGEDLILPQDKTYNETVIVAAKKLTINSPINGDLICAGSDVLINSNVAGDIICAAENIKISGRLTGNLRVAGRNVDVGAEVHSSASLAGETVNLRPETAILGDLLAAASTLDISGRISRDIALASNTINMSSQSLRHVYIYSANPKFSETAKIGGNLDVYYPSDKNVTVPDRVVTGQTNLRPYQVTSPKDIKNQTTQTDNLTSQAVAKLISILSFLILGLLLARFIPTRTGLVTTQITSRPFASLFGGLGILIFGPILFLLTLISVVGIPAAFVLFLFYIVAIIVSRIFVALVIGRFISQKFITNTRFHQLYYYLLIGVPVLWLITAIPGLGAMVNIIAYFVGVGAFFLSFFPVKKTVESVK